MRKALGILALMAAALPAPPAGAQTRFTVQQLREMCVSADVPRQNACGAYIAGVRQTLDVFKVSLKDRVAYCIPASVTNRQVKDSFVAWAERNAAAATRSAISGVIRSVQEAYGCRKPGGETLEF